MAKQCYSCGNDLMAGEGETCPDCGDGPLGNCCIDTDDHECDHGGDSAGYQYKDEWSGDGDE